MDGAAERASVRARFPPSFSRARAVTSSSVHVGVSVDASPSEADASSVASAASGALDRPARV